MNLAALIGVLTFVLGALSFAAAGLNGRRKDGQIDLLTDGNAELRAQADDKDKVIAEQNAKLKLAADAAIAADKIRQTVVDLAQSRPDFSSLGIQMLQQHQELLGAIGKQTAQLTNLAKIISKERE
jgi:hypothetical protein